MVRSSVIKRLLTDAIEEKMKTQIAFYEGDEGVRLDMEPEPIRRMDGNQVDVRVTDTEGRRKTFTIKVTEVMS